jgi:hypothetical protein
MLSPYHAGTQLELLVGMYGVEARLSGEVRWVNARIGMGVMFVDLEERQSKNLNALIAAAAGRSPAQR